MNSSDRSTLWNQKYEQGLPSLTKPDPFFLSAYPSFPNAGTALDLAGGLGRHALWLASKNWRVTVVDISEVALGKLSEAAGQLDLPLRLHTRDVAEYDFEPERLDLVILFYHFDRRLFPKIASALKPGGLVICKMAVRLNSETTATQSDECPLGKNELVSLFPKLDVIHHRERPVRDRGVVEFVGKKSDS